MSTLASERSSHSISLASTAENDGQELYCPFPSAIHPEVAEIQAHTMAWAIALGLAHGERAASRLDFAKIGWLAARANPRAPRALVELVADWTTLFCLLDDHIERFAEAQAVGSYLDEVLAALTIVDARPGDSIQCAARDLQRRLKVLADRHWHARFASKLRELFDAFELEAHRRRSGGTADVRAYLAMREVTVGVWVELELSELALGVELTREERASTRMIGRIACNLVGWANDIHTYEKELEAGDPNNLVLVLSHATRIDLRSALARVSRMHDREANELAQRITQIELAGTDGERHFAAIVGHWVRGHLDWARETGRYAG